jgi:hypothetical protein
MAVPANATAVVEHAALRSTDIAESRPSVSGS